MPSEKKKFLIIEKKVSIWTKVGPWYEKNAEESYLPFTFFAH